MAVSLKRRFSEVEVDAVPIVEGFSMAVEVFSHGPTIEAVRGGNLDFGVKPRSGENQPEKRRNLILKQLLNAPTCIIQGIEAPAELPSTSLAFAKCIHKTGFLEFLVDGHKQWLKEGRDLSFTLDSLPQEDPANQTFVPFHFLRTAGEEPRGKQAATKVGFYANDATTPIFPDTPEVLENDLAIVSAAVHALKSGTRNVYALTCMPGHHAAPFNYGGYCFLNYAAIAAYRLQKHGFQVGILDVDYHGGDGTLHCLEADAEVCTAYVSIHSGSDYPYLDFGENGVEFSVKADWPQYSEILQTAIARIKAKDINALVVCLGLDTLGDDPDASLLAGCNLKVADFKTMGEVLKGLDVPILITQEGGYKLEEVAQAVEEFLKGILGE